MKYLAPLTVALAIALIAIVSNNHHPFEDPAELKRAIQLGWAIRGLAEHDGIDSKNFQEKCLGPGDYDACRAAIGSVVLEVRHKHGIPGPLPGAEPQPTSSVPIEAQRP